MFGLEVYVIFQDRDDTRYWYKGTEVRGRHVWTNKRIDAYVFENASEATELWINTLNKKGSVTGTFI